MDHAVLGLWRRSPDLSARTGITAWQVSVLSLVAGGFAGLGIALPEIAIFLFSVVLAVPFLCVVALRTLAIAEVLRVPAEPSARRAAPACASGMPYYSILVPLFDEAAVMPRLLKALGALDYPVDRLEILLILESVDAATRRSLAAIRLPPHFRIVVVPERQPRTKPKALNYALAEATGDLVVVFDAEDIPESDQLRRAATVFLQSGPELACIQACLNIDEPDRGLLTRQFTLEYTALFDALLPALERLRLPIPLGGTSNHFRAEALRAAGGWDPFNVTEDADLGIRLARLGFQVGTLRSTTWEEAPNRFGNWFRQRTRWLKGWMQTYLVHTRAPLSAARELGGRQTLGLHVLMGGILLSVLAYPIGLAMLAFGYAEGRLYDDPETSIEGWLWWISAINLALGFVSSITVAMLATWRRGRSWLAPWALLMPLYWLLISAAGYRALWQLFREPHRWEKTKHGDGDV